MKKILKKSLTLLLILMVIFALPINNVKAEDEGSLGSAAGDVILCIVKYDDVESTESVVQYKLIGNPGNYSIEPDGSIDNLSVSFVEEDPIEDSYFKIEINGEVNIKGYLDEGNGGIYTLIKSPENIKIVGDGQLNMTVISKPDSSELDDTLYCFMDVVDGDLQIGDEDSDLTINLNTSVDPNDVYPYLNLDGFVADRFCIYNTQINSKIKNTAFVSKYDPDSYEQCDLFYMESSKLNVEYKPLNAYDKYDLNDGESKFNNLFSDVFYCITSYEENNNACGSFTVINSKLDFEFIGEDLESDFAISLQGPSSFNLMGSKLDFHSNSEVSFLRSSFADIYKCKDINCIQDSDDAYNPIFEVNGFTLCDTNFTIESQHSIFDPYDDVYEYEEERPLGTNFSKDINNPYFITIEETSNSYKGSMKINNNSNNDYLLSHNYNQVKSFKANYEDAKYWGFIIASKGVLKTKEKLNSKLETPKVKNDHGLRMFNLSRQKGDDIYANAKWKYFEINPSETSDDSKHVVLNTGIN